MRGKAACRGRTCNYPGITPACAGKRQAEHRHRQKTWDHPRVCGEKYSFAFLRFAIPGSPPRVRGKASGSWKCFCAMGITPACAGKRTQYFPACSCIWDHPRVCGEKKNHSRNQKWKIGSPPRVRGKVSQKPVRVYHPGITPACAGKRSDLQPHTGNGQDHPRVCGEKQYQIAAIFTGIGSPPRVRGKVEFVLN